MEVADCGGSVLQSVRYLLVVVFFNVCASGTKPAFFSVSAPALVFPLVKE